MLVLMALLPMVHLLSIASLDCLSRLPFLKVRLRFDWSAMWDVAHGFQTDVFAPSPSFHKWCH